MKARVLFFVAASAALYGGCHEGHAPHDHGSAAPPSTSSAPSGANPVQQEMVLLQGAMRTALDGIASGDVREVPHALHRVHEAKGATKAALERGGYRPPKNGDKVARFRELDEAFHGHLERMVEASARNDVAATGEAFGAAVGACQGCHAEFRR